MTDRLRTRPAATSAMLAVWSDAATIACALEFETALAHAQAAEGLIAADAAHAIERACANIQIDADSLAEEASLAGTLAIPLVQRLRATGGWEVHLGATSQDLADTVMMMQVRAAGQLLVVDVRRLATALRPLAERHAMLPAVGRTLLQDAMPIGFGLRIAQWRAAIVDAGKRLEAIVLADGCLQLGGAAGTRAGMKGRGGAVAARMAEKLGVASAPPWHARRAGVAGIAAAVGILIGVIGKMARDVALLSQNAIAEVHEPVIAGRGGSSAMGHKRNPTGCQVALAAASRAPGLVSNVLMTLPAELERGIGGWQAEAPMIAELFLLASEAAAAMAVVAEGLEIDPIAIGRNLAAAAIGDDIGESVALVVELLATRD